MRRGDDDVVGVCVWGGGMVARRGRESGAGAGGDGGDTRRGKHEVPAALARGEGGGTVGETEGVAHWERLAVARAQMGVGGAGSDWDGTSSGVGGGARWVGTGAARVRRPLYTVRPPPIGPDLFYNMTGPTTFLP